MSAAQRLNQRVKHAAWKWTGTVVDFDFDGNRLSNVTVLRDDTGEEESIWIPCLVVIKDEEEEFDWNDD